MREPATRPAGVALRPFRGLRYDPRLVDLRTVTTGPLEPSDTAAAAAALSSDEHNIAWLIDPLLSAASPQPHQARRIALRLASWRDAGIVRHDRSPAVYVYGQRRGERTLLGLIGAVSLHEPSELVVLAHEQVAPANVARHVALLETTAAQPEPVVLVHPGSDDLREMLMGVTASAPLVSFGDGTVEHRLWSVTDSRRLSAAAAAVADSPLLIADGHHRYAAFRRFQIAHARHSGAPWDYGLAMIVDGGDSSLTVGPIHRIVPATDWDLVRRTPGLDSGLLADEPAANAFLADDSAHPSRCVITDGNQWRAVVPRGAARGAPSGQHDDLAVTWLHERWLPRWGVSDADVGHDAEQTRAVDRARRTGGLAILLPAPALGTIIGAARRGQLLPAKATSFGPKPYIGLVMRHWPAGLDDLDHGAPPVSADSARGAPA